ncbi:MAG: GlcNAc-PI de-N-acetylase [Micavibrio sp. TMED27]|nr:GlcNAc-PI de-N-acetylase [Micavibrio sp.]OUT93038.1 MAG: GlcNAc-PI de-N-acetylase [Micavibrio sp. TMED27]|tara:strand:+ start:13280 stop:13984 length:705 start_codon:yes stop_codon:yes gene_type:complete
MSKNILVIAAHPDDEILGCGGAMAKHIANGDHVSVVIMAEGLTSRYNTREEAFAAKDEMAEELEELKNIARKANEKLGVKDVNFEGFPDNRMDSVDLLDIVKRVEHHVQRVKPDIIYTHHAGDVNIDHQQIHDAVVTASRPMPGGLKPTILFFEVASSTHWQPPISKPAFAPTWFTDISDFLDQKIEALAVYEGEMRPWPHARSLKALEHLARWNGANIGVEAAENFILGRHCD